LGCSLYSIYITSINEFRKMISEYTSAFLLVDEHVNTAMISLNPDLSFRMIYSIKCLSLSRRLSGVVLLLNVF
jgi:hypothetical protein